MLEKRAKNYYILARISEMMGMLAEAASNYFKALTSANDFFLLKLGIRVKDHKERFSLLKINNKELYKIADRVFPIYRKAYTSIINIKEIKELRRKVEEVFKNVKIDIPAEEEIKKRIERLFK